MVWKSFYFGGESSASHGLFITGEAVYNAPKYDYDFVSIQGRNGDLILDNGRFENITVTYPCSMRDVSKLADVRTWLYSQRGYQRLTDDYNVNEYRMACVSEGLEINPFHNHAADFTITFNCKPQRYLVNGETPQYFTPIYTDGVEYFTAWLQISDTLFETMVLNLKDANGTAGSMFTNLKEARWRTLTGTDVVYSRATLADYMAMVDGVADLDLQAAGVGVGTPNSFIRFVFTSPPDGYTMVYAADGEAYNAQRITIATETTIDNPTAYNAAPLLEYDVEDFFGTASLALPEITINGVTVAVSDYNGILYIDTEIQDAYIDNGGVYENGNSYVTLTKDGEYTTDFPVLSAGETVVNTLYTGTVASIDVNLGAVVIAIYPRYYTI